MPVHLLNELVKQTPEGVYLSLIKQDGQTVTVGGVAQTNERVSELLRNTAYNSSWLERPELIEIKAANLKPDGREQRRLYEFSMRVGLKRPQDADAGKAAPAPSAASAPKAVVRSERLNMAKASRNVNLSELSGEIASQFRGLNPNEPGQWPILPRLATWLFAALAVVVLGWFLVLSAEADNLEAERQEGAGLSSRTTAASCRKPSTWASCASNVSRFRNT